MEHIAGGVRFQLYPRLRKKRAVTLICYYLGSRRVQHTFKGDQDAARKHCKDLSRQVTSGDGALHLTPLDHRVWLAAKDTAAKIGRAPDAICRDYLEAAQILGPGVSILEAARDWRRRHRLGLPKATIAHVVAELLASLEGKKRAASTIKSLKIPLKSFGEHLRMPIGDVQTSDIEQWLRLFPRLAPRTLNNWISAVTRLFNFAKGRYLPADARTAADALDTVTDDRRGAVQIFQPWELAKLLAHAPYRLRPLIAIGAFAGLRTIELQRLHWSAVHFDPSAGHPHGFIEVGGSVAKQHRTAARRIIPIQPNLAAWLEDYRLCHGRISHYTGDKQISRAISRIIDRVNVVQKKHRLPQLGRPANGLRHSYGSYRLPVVSSVDLLALEMNNSAKEIVENYRELVHPDRVPEYWSLQPVAPVTITQLDFPAESFGT